MQEYNLVRKSMELRLSSSFMAMEPIPHLKKGWRRQREDHTEVDASEAVIVLWRCLANAVALLQH